ncbi:MAG: membrane dipeptidase [Gemmatimonadetes bacterium]|nr:membrane dipeptidase [Gemmatimonadota bacterium]
MITRRRFLQDSMLATAGLSILPATGAFAEPAQPDAYLSFDLHTHPGAFFNKGRPEYAGDAAAVKTVTNMRDGRLTGAFFSLVADAALIELTPTGVVTHGEYAAGEAAREYERQLATVAAFMKTVPAFQATKTSDLLRAQREGKVAAYLACEGGDFLDGKPERVDRLYADGVRSLQLVHYVPSALGDLQTHAPQHGGLSPFGKAVVKRMNATRMLIDVAHASFETVRDVVSLTSAPIILSHSILKMEESRLLAARAISKEHALLVAKTGGVIGLWPSGFNASFAEFVDNTKRLIDVVGIDHVGLGTDMDGNLKPVFTSYTQLGDWASDLQAHGLTRAEAAKVLGGNVQRVLGQVIG